ncbi:MAG: phosphoribosylanthranilate isomerase [Bacteroidota bacterium]
MEKLQIKVCGMREQENILEIDGLKPDLMGFIFYDRSPRYVGGNDLYVSSEVSKVGVFVNAKVEEILELDREHKFDFIQLHGNESPEYCSELKSKGHKLLKAFGISEDFNFDKLNQYENTVDYFLFDTKTKDHGGSGVKFNWEVLDKYKLETPFFLSGGIDEDSAADIKKLKEKHNRFIGIDLNSRFEISPALKDKKRLEVLFTKLKEYGIA